MHCDQPCSQTEILKRLSTSDPDLLAERPWRQHLEQCGPCNQTLREYGQSLTLFVSMESECREHLPELIDWQSFSVKLKLEARPWWKKGGLHYGMVASFALLAVLISAVLWGGQWTGGPSLQDLARSAVKQESPLNAMSTLGALSDRLPFWVIPTETPGRQIILPARSLSLDPPARGKYFAPRARLFGPDMKTASQPPFLLPGGPGEKPTLGSIAVTPVRNR